MATGRSSKRISPPSIGWIPATHLTSVDFPAPLSPTSAVTSPARTEKSTSCSTWTAPKLLLTLFSCRSTPASSPVVRGPGAVGGSSTAHRARIGPRSLSADVDAELLAGVGQRADADLRRLDLALVDHGLDVLLGDRLRGEQHRLDLP